MSKKNALELSASQMFRILDICERLKKNGFFIKGDIVSDHDCDDRTVSRDIKFLNEEYDARIKHNRKTNRHESANPNFDTPGLLFGQDEITNVFISTRLLSQYKNTPIAESVGSLINGMQLLTSRDISIEPAWLNEHFSSIEDAAPDIKKEVWKDILFGINQKQQIQITYKRPRIESKTHNIMINPHHLLSYKMDWYVIAYVPDKLDYRTYALSRIQRTRRNNRSFKRRLDFDFNNFRGNYYGIIKSDETYTVKIKFNPQQAQYIMERKWHSSQKNEIQPDSSLIATFTVQHLYEIKRWILSQGADAEVLEPGELKEEIAADIKRLNTVYN